MPKHNFFKHIHKSSTSELFRSDVNNLLRKFNKIQELKLPKVVHLSNISKPTFKHLLDCQITSRLLDYAGHALFRNQQGYYNINNLGHESMAAIAYHMKLSDPKLLHYRSGAAYIEWLVRAGEDPIINVLRSIVCSHLSFSGGRHKVFGSLSANIIPQTSTIASHIPKAVGLAVAIHKAQLLKTPCRFPADSIIFCSFGDGSFNHGSAQDAFNMVEWHDFQKISLPMLMICENNGVSISANNPPGYIERSMRSRSSFCYLKADGTNLFDTFEKSQLAIKMARELKRSVFLDVKTTRLGAHYLDDMIDNSDAHSLAEDPLLMTIRFAVEYGFFIDAITETINSITHKIITTLPKVLAEPKLQQKICHENPRKHYWQMPIFPSSSHQHKSLTLAETLNKTLTHIMEQDAKIIILGDDVADHKGGVWGVTKNLMQRFGKERVFNTPITETFLLAMAQMMGLNGLLPIVELRHLAFLHNAIDQIRGEASTSLWLSNGLFPSPFVLRIPGLGYSSHGGHFHNDTSTAALREIPGLIIACASTPQAAEKLLPMCVDMAFNAQQIVVFIEPMMLYHHSNSYCQWRNDSVSSNKIGVYGHSDQLTIISYGNGFQLAMSIIDEFKSTGIFIQVIDLQMLKPLPIAEIIAVIKTKPNILVIDEGRKTGSISEEIFTCLVEAALDVKMHRITSIDSFVPLGPAALSIFPQKEQVLAIINQDILNLKHQQDACTLKP